jgi:tetratricopeptide (TPR) repeat protein
VAFGFEVPLRAGGNNRRNFKSATLDQAHSLQIDALALFFLRSKSAMQHATRMIAGPGLPASFSGPRRLAISHAMAALAVAGALLGPSAAQAEGTSDSAPEPAVAADPRQLCLAPASTLDERLSGCTAMIESGKAQGSMLAAAYAQRGFVFTLRRNLEQAHKDLDQAVKIAPDYTEAYINRANFWTVSNQPERAIADAERAIELAPKAPLAYFVRAGGEAKLGQYDKAIADYDEVLRLNPNAGASVYGPRGHAYYRKRDYDRAIADYDELIKLDPNDVGAYLNRGDALRSKGELARAGEDYGEAIRLAPDNPGGFGGRGQIRLVTHDFAGAVADFDTALKLNPNDVNSHINRGAALSLLGENLRALQDFDKVIAIEPQNPLAYVERAQAMHALGDNAGAFAAVNVALKLVPKFPTALDALKTIGTPKNAAQILAGASGLAEASARPTCRRALELRPGLEGGCRGAQGAGGEVIVRINSPAHEVRGRDNESAWHGVGRSFTSEHLHRCVRPCGQAAMIRPPPSRGRPPRW